MQLELSNQLAPLGTEVGDAILSAAYTTYLGVFPFAQRKTLLAAVKAAIEGEADQGFDVVCSEEFSLEEFFDATAVRAVKMPCACAVCVNVCVHACIFMFCRYVHMHPLYT